MMNGAERKALERAYTLILKDLDPDEIFTHSLYVNGVISQAQCQNIDGCKTREGKVTRLSKCLPRCGPLAFESFKTVLNKRGFPWLAEALDQHLQELQEDANIKKKLYDIVRNQIHPLLCKPPRLDPKLELEGLVDKLGSLLKLLQKQCSEGNARRGKKTLPLKEFIDLLKEKKKKAETESEIVECQLEQLKEATRSEIKELKKQIREMKNELNGLQEPRKLKKEIENLRKEVKEKVKVQRENKNLKDRLKLLMAENQDLKQVNKDLTESLQVNGDKNDTEIQ